jgi:hypothetical protein
MVALDQNNSSKGPKLFIITFDRAKSFTVVSGARFPCITYGIPTRLRGGMVALGRNKSCKGP